MKYEPIPVTPAVITWARVRAGYSLEDARKKFGAIEQWESAKASPTYPQLEAMAERFKVPVAVFFFPQPPDVPPISESFRTIPEHEFDQLPPRILYLVRKAKALQLSWAELTAEKNPAERLITNDLALTEPDTSIPALAGRVRDYLAVSLDEQRGWPNVQTALENWRRLLWEVGVYVFKEAFRTKGYSGFSLYDDAFPIVYVNNTSAKTRQIFTLFHELAHLLFHTSGIDSLSDEFIAHLPDNAHKIEVVCNRFAAEFLLPETVFESAFAGMEPTRATADVLARRYHVSRESIYRRIRDRGLISQTEYEAAARKWADEKKGGDGGDYYNTVIAYLGRDYINLAFSHYYQSRIDESQLAEYLDVKPKNLSTLEDYLLRGVE